MTPGEVLKAARKARGLSQEELAVKIRRTQGAVDHWEAGRRTPRRPTAEKLDRTLKAGGRVMRAFGYAPDRAATFRPVAEPEGLPEFRKAALAEMQRLARQLDELREDVDGLLAREPRPDQGSG